MRTYFYIRPRPHPTTFFTLVPNMAQHLSRDLFRKFSFHRKGYRSNDYTAPQKHPFCAETKMANRTKASEQLSEFSQAKKVGIKGTIWLRMTTHYCFPAYQLSSCTRTNRPVLGSACIHPKKIKSSVFMDRLRFLLIF